MPKLFGCVKCAAEYKVTPPDDFYTEARSKYKENINDDMVPMEKVCIYCKNINKIYWYKPS